MDTDSLIAVLRQTAAEIKDSHRAVASILFTISACLALDNGAIDELHSLVYDYATEMRKTLAIRQ